MTLYLPIRLISMIALTLGWMGQRQAVVANMRQTDGLLVAEIQ
jgi:hypothetical protein